MLRTSSRIKQNSPQVTILAVETVSDFIFLGSKITADGDCSHEIKRHLLLGRKAMTNLNSVLKSIDTGREVGGEFRMGNTCIPVVDSC